MYLGLLRKGQTHYTWLCLQGHPLTFLYFCLGNMDMLLGLRVACIPGKPHSTTENMLCLPNTNPPDLIHQDFDNDLLS